MGRKRKNNCLYWNWGLREARDRLDAVVGGGAIGRFGKRKYGRGWSIQAGENSKKDMDIRESRERRNKSEMWDMEMKEMSCRYEVCGSLRCIYLYILCYIYL